MTFNITYPSSTLAPFVHYFWSMKSTERPAEFHKQRIVPSGFIEITFYLNNPPQYIGKYRESDNIIINGQHTNPYDILITNTFELISVVLKPQGAMAFFNLPLNEILNHSISASQLFKPEINTLNEQLLLNKKDKVVIIEQFLLKQLKYNYNHYNFKRISLCIEALTHAKANVAVEELASLSYLSKKQFERNFTSSIGIPPKKYLRIIRFQYTLHIKQQNKNINLTELAHTCGYYDQSHMIYEFRQLSGLTPTSYFNQCEPYSDYFGNL